MLQDVTWNVQLSTRSFETYKDIRRFDPVLRKKDIIDSVSRFGEDLEARNLKMEQQTSCLLKTERKGSSISRSVGQHPVYQRACGVWEGWGAQRWLLNNEYFPN